MLLYKIIDGLAVALNWLAGAIIVFVMFCVFADVVSRALVNVTGGTVDFTFRGGIELVKFGLMFSVLFAFPFAVDKAQIVVDLFTQNMALRLQTAIDAFFLIMFSVLSTLLCWRFAEASVTTWYTGEKTQDLMISLTYIYAIASMALGILALRALATGLNQLINGKPVQVIEYTENGDNL